MTTVIADSAHSDEQQIFAYESWITYRVDWKTLFVNQLSECRGADERSQIIMHMIMQLSRENMDPVFRVDILNALGAITVDMHDVATFGEFNKIILSEHGLFSGEARIREAAVAVLDPLCGNSARFRDQILEKCTYDTEFRSAQRTCIRDDRKDSGTEAVLGFPDAEGWGSLETSLKGISVSLRHIQKMDSLLLQKLVGIVKKCCNHTNRFAREQSQLCCQQLIRLSHASGEFDDHKAVFCDLLCSGMMDNWSQVRYAALQSSRALVRVYTQNDKLNSLQPSLVGQILINRHFVAEGVRRYAQETWRLMFGSSGGIKFLVDRLPEILQQMSTASESPNQSVREAVISLVYEIVYRVALVNPQSIGESGLGMVLSICVNACEDESWPVREVAARSVRCLYGPLLDKLPGSRVRLLEDKTTELINIIFGDVFDAMKVLRESASEAVAVLVGLHMSKSGHEDSVSSDVNRILASKFSSWKSHSHHKHTEQSHENRPMYSCGTLLANNAKRPTRVNLSDDCCSAGSCHSASGASSQDETDGAFRLSSALVSDVRLPSNQVSGISSLFWSHCKEVLGDSIAPLALKKSVLECIAHVLRTNPDRVSAEQRKLMRETIDEVHDVGLREGMRDVISLLDRDSMVINP
jgi:hypothetical protein